jgi:VWFA-related protein
MWCSATRTVLFFALLTSVLAAQQTTIRVPVRLVSVPTLVFSKQGRLLPGLQKDDFRIYDNGRLQKINLNLDTDSRPISVALVVQINSRVRDYLPFIAKVGSIVDNLLLGETGEVAVLTYNEDIAIKKPFESGDAHSAMKNISVGGERARLIDAGLNAIALLKNRPISRMKVLLFIGQSMDSGSTATLPALLETAERESVSVYALALPLYGKAFIPDTFSLEHISAKTIEKGGYKANVELTKLIPALKGSQAAAAHQDVFSVLTTATGGTLLHFRKQNQLEDALIAIGNALRSTYFLSYTPNSTESGYHKISVNVDLAGATTYSRAGYLFNTN